MSQLKQLNVGVSLPAFVWNAYLTLTHAGPSGFMGYGDLFGMSHL